MPKSDKRGDDDTGAPAEPAGVATSVTMMLIAAGRTAQRRFEAALADRRITLRHIGALGHLARNPELSYSDLARRARVTPQSMHATIGQLVDLGALTADSGAASSAGIVMSHPRNPDHTHGCERAGDPRAQGPTA